MNLASLLSQISFGSPLILAALTALPVLWWLLRVTPPLPRRTLFPPLRLLRGLEDEEQTPAATPWWLLLLRLLAAALLNEGEAARIIKELKPMAWPGDRAAAAAALGRFSFSAPPSIYWLSDGID